MMARLLFLVSSALALAGTSALASPVVRRDTESFQLWAYGPGPLGGFPVVYKEGLAYAVRPDIMTNGGDYVNITFTESSADASMWIISPAANSSAFGSSLKLGVDVSSTSNEPVGFSTTTSNSTWSTSGWRFYGSTVLWLVDDTLESKFYATNTSQADGVWSLVWNADTTAGDIYPIALRSRAPITVTESE